MSDTESIATLLGTTDAFASCPAPVLEEIAGNLSESVVAPGAELVEKGAKCRDVFVAVSGRFGVFIDPAAEEPAVVLERGAVFGEIGAVSGIEATASVRALDEASVLAIPVTDLHRHMRRTPELAASMLRSLSQYLGKD